MGLPQLGINPLKLGCCPITIMTQGALSLCRQAISPHFAANLFQAIATGFQNVAPASFLMKFVGSLRQGV